MSRTSTPSSLELSGLPDPLAEIRIRTLHSVRGANFWSRRPITRMDVQIGAFEDISSAHAPWLTDQLVSALPGLDGHFCSVGRRGGFIERLHEGTYAAHITEHVALELQSMIGHSAGFGRTRGTGTLGEYTITLEHMHEAVGLRSLALALEIVQRAFAGTVRTIEPVLSELRALARTPDVAPLSHRVFCGITGSFARALTREAIVARRAGARAARAQPDVRDTLTVVDVAPAYLLQAGLPYTESELAVILDVAPTDVPARFQELRRAAKLVSIVADAVPAGGVVICPANARQLHDIIRDAGGTVQTFAPSDDAAVIARRVARCVGDDVSGRLSREQSAIAR